MDDVNVGIFDKEKRKMVVTYLSVFFKNKRVEQYGAEGNTLFSLFILLFIK
jgi:hypothetical protein